MVWPQPANQNFVSSQIRSCRVLHLHFIILTFIAQESGTLYTFLAKSDNPVLSVFANLYNQIHNLMNILKKDNLTINL